MDYNALAVEMLDKMHAQYKSTAFKQIHEALHGGAFILQYIALNGGSVLPGDICLKMNISSARVAVVLNSLEKKGLITRKIDENDRRKVIVSITADGRESAEKQYNHIIEGASKMLGLLGENDAKEYVRIMGKMMDIMPELWKNWSLDC